MFGWSRQVWKEGLTIILMVLILHISAYLLTILLGIDPHESIQGYDKSFIAIFLLCFAVLIGISYFISAAIISFVTKVWGKVFRNKQAM